MDSKCAMCGTTIPFKAEIKLGKTSVCRPVGSDCHTLAKKTKHWVLTPQQAQELLDELFNDKDVA